MIYINMLVVESIVTTTKSSSKSIPTKRVEWYAVYMFFIKWNAVDTRTPGTSVATSSSATIMFVRRQCSAV